MLFTEVLDSLAPDGDALAVTVPGDWMQGRSVFGGMQAALALRAMRALVPADLPLRALQTTFVGPVEGAVRVSARVLRTGKNVVHVEARILLGQETSTLIVGIFGRGRPSQAEAEARPPAFTPLAEPFVFPFVPGFTASFAQHFKMKWLAGDLPFAGVRAAPSAVMDIDFADPGRTSEAHLVALADVPPPLALSMLTERAMGSSLTWTLEVLSEEVASMPLEGWREYVGFRAGHAGYTHQSVMVCAPGGAPVALSDQTMVVFG